MKNGKYIIGMCLTNIYLEHERNLLNSLYTLSQDYPVKIIVFQCYYDRFGEGLNTKTSTAVFDLINYDMLDVMVVNSYSIADQAIVKKIIRNSRSHNVPLISLDSFIEAEVDIAIKNDRKKAFEDVVEHMIKDHDVDDILYISGRKGDITSDLREDIFREVMQRNGHDVDEDMIVYGDFWRVKTRSILRKMYGNGQPLPQAIICGNDVSAQETCDFLFEIGKSVPEDVIVSGFDGFDVNQFYFPLVTTAGVDYDETAKGVLESTMRLVKKEPYDHYYITKSRLVKGESCGCTSITKKQRVLTTSRLYKHYTDRSHLDNMFFGINTFEVERKDVITLRDDIKYSLFNESAIFINDDCCVEAGVPMAKHTLENPFSDKMVLLCGKDEAANIYDISTIDRKDLFHFDVTASRGDTANKITVITSLVSPKNIYGYYMCDLDDFEDGSYELQMMVRSLNNTLNIRDKSHSNDSLVDKMQDIVKRENQTHLLNLSGLKDELDKLYAGDPDRKKYKLCVSLYSMVSWQYIYQNYGIEDANDISKMVAEALVIANPKDALIGRISNENFIIINYMAPDEDLGTIINNATSTFYKTIELANKHSGRSYYVEVHAGCTTAMPGFKGTLNDLIKIANNEMLVNRLRNNQSSVKTEKVASLEKKQAFIKLLDNNLFYYHFQPIVDAKNGEIYAYEALMRTPPEIGLNPGEILDIATELGRLYDIEKATLNNVMAAYYNHPEKFNGKKVFMNSIPGHNLNRKDFEALFEKYGTIGKHFVIETTEQTSRSDEEMYSFIDMITKMESQFAVDDYGAGNSNIVNLLKFSPNVIKIDRYLVDKINENVNKQMFVKNIIEFANKNNIKIIAEGVETKEELEMVVGYGANLIQGYYTARPQAEPLADIVESVKEIIIKSNNRECE